MDLCELGEEAGEVVPGGLPDMVVIITCGALG